MITDDRLYLLVDADEAATTPMREPARIVETVERRVRTVDERRAMTAAACAARRPRGTTMPFVGAALASSYRAGAEILAGTAAFPARPRQQRYPVRCPQCPATWLIGDTQAGAQARLQDHQRERHP